MSVAAGNLSGGRRTRSRSTSANGSGDILANMEGGLYNSNGSTTGTGNHATKRRAVVEDGKDNRSSRFRSKHKENNSDEAAKALLGGDVLEIEDEIDHTTLKLASDLNTYRLVNFFTSGLSFMLGILATTFWPFMAVHITEGLGMSESQLGFIMAAYASPNFVTFAFLAQLLNLHGPWKVITLGGCVTTLSAVFYSLTSFNFLVVAGFLQGFGGCLLESGIQALVSQLPDKMQTILAANNMAQMAGGLAGPILGALLSERVPEMNIPGACMALASIGGVTVLATEVGKFYNSAEHSASPLGGEYVPMKTVLRRKAVCLGCLGIMCSYILNGFLMVGSFTHVKQALQISTNTLAIVFIIPQMIYSFAAGCTALLGTRFTASFYASFGVCTMGVSLILFGPAVPLGGVITHPDAAKVIVLVSLLCFEVGSAVFYMPLVPMMQMAVQDLGTGGKNTTVSLYILVQGIGELFGRGLSGMFIQHSSEAKLLTCDKRDFGGRLEDELMLDLLEEEDCMSSFPRASMYMGGICLCIGTLIITGTICDRKRTLLGTTFHRKASKPAEGVSTSETTFSKGSIIDANGSIRSPKRLSALSPKTSPPVPQLELEMQDMDSETRPLFTTI